ncbi:helix-loop-helix protein delilah-like [Littorina saxatilis]|uniref:BHLH domain-containing protein n=1 Tax=Littorina saxatilis TaxID=31220 RepID=A0AAN9GDX5_9CAEN
MDSSSDEISSLSVTSDESMEASSSGAGISEDSAQCVSDDSKCRKSSRIRAKKDKQAQDATSGSSNDAYNLRLSSLVKRVQVERNRSTPKQPKGKSKPPPLSKYRRRTANARERMRMQDINEGYEGLRQCLPGIEVQSQGKKKEAPTKFTILSLAINYIHALRDILGYPPLDSSSGADDISSILGENSSVTGESSNITDDISNLMDKSSSSIDTNNNNCSSSSSSSPGTSTSNMTSNSIAATVSCNEDSNPGTNTACIRAHNVSSAPYDEICSHPDPFSAAGELKYCGIQTEFAPQFVPPLLHEDFAVTTKHFSRCHDPLPGSALMMDFRAEARFSPSSSASDPSQSPSPPHPQLPDDCLDLEESDLLHVSISLPALHDMVDIDM